MAAVCSGRSIADEDLPCLALSILDRNYSRKAVREDRRPEAVLDQRCVVHPDGA
jgi:hypothetical protein